MRRVIGPRVSWILLPTIALSLTSARPATAAVHGWTYTGSMATARGFHTATPLPGGRVLVAGGYNDTSGVLASAEVYDPASGTWSPTGNMVTGREYHTAAHLPGGRVLVAGGFGPSGSSGTLAGAEVYDPASGAWAPTGSMATPRELHTATRLPGGGVLVAGGLRGYNHYLATAEVYDPASGTWSPAGRRGHARVAHAA